MAAFFKEPLFHFLILGSLLFFFLSDTQVLQDKIIISNAKISQLSSQFNKTRHRAPTPQELDALTDDYLKDLIAFKKGQEMHLIEGDSIIQRRVRQKVEFILESSIATLTPSDEELQVYMVEHQDDFMNEPLYSFEQIYIDENRHKNLDLYIQETLLKLNSFNRSELGDTLMLERSLNAVSSSEIKRVFGQKFFQGLENIDLGKWSKVYSGYGLHLVKIKSKTTESVGDFELNKRRLLLSYIQNSQKNALKEFYAIEKSNASIQIGDE